MSTLTVQPSSKDTMISEDSPNSNYGSEIYFYVSSQVIGGSGVNYRTILEFIIDIPASAVVTSATLYLYNHYRSNSAGRTYDVYRLTRTDWVESQATWNIYKTSSNWISAGGDYTSKDGQAIVPGSNGWMSWDVTDSVQYAQANSQNVELLVRDETESEDATSRTSGFCSNEYADDTSLRPKLIINYSPATSPFPCHFNV